ncbi:MAG: hypothetical protein NTW42_01685 [Deltaproteobacteria bacterium]|nr:hypothetical protein [Deltaproteobacteria bacterium]
MRNHKMIYGLSFFYSALTAFLFITFFYKQNGSALSSFIVPVILLAPILFVAVQDVSLLFVSFITLLGLVSGLLIDLQIKNIVTWKMTVFAWIILSIPAIVILNVSSILIRIINKRNKQDFSKIYDSHQIDNNKIKLSKKIFTTIFLVLCCFSGLLIYSGTQKSNSEVGRFAKKEEIVGYWKLVTLPHDLSQKINKVNPWPLPYQWFAIYNDGKIFSFMSSKDQVLTAIELDKLCKSIPPNTTYEFNSGFLTVSYSDMKNIKELWGVNIIKKEIKIRGVAPALPGDIVMSIQGGPKDGIIYFRHLRKII